MFKFSGDLSRRSGDMAVLRKIIDNGTKILQKR